ncbi:MAG TPA: hypothetical protein VHY48_05755 [Acidobacteriaceae bacterium]|jgi:Tfp pilus assembly protein PilF|nr:hypothetical protein [Acidobacteriaceae bacterium]
MIEKEDETLQGWNAIAEFLTCDVRTAKRWEQYRHLPVRRMRRTPGEGRANVYAVTTELDAWRASAEAAFDLPLQPVVSGPAEDTERSTAQSAAAGGGFERRERSAFRRWAVALLAFGMCVLLMIAAWRLGHAAAKPARSAIKAEQPSHSIVAASSGGARAEDLYLQGAYLFEQRTPETLQQAKVDFQEAIAANPGYAPAYAGLAETYDLLREYATLPSAEAYPLAKKAAERAIALDPKLAEAHAALGYEEFFWEWDGARAEREFKEAIALGPSSAVAHHWYGAMLMHQTRYAEALDQLDRAQVLEPSSAGVLGTRAYALGLSGRRDEAADLLQDILTRVPDSAPLHFILAQLSLQEPRDIPRYLDQMRRFAELRHSEEEMKLLEAAEPAYRRGGETAMWRAMLEVEQKLHPDAAHPTYFMVELETALGMNDAALRDLARLVRDHNEQMVGLKIDAMLTPLYGDPRFVEIVDQVRLPKAAAINVASR